MSMNRPMRPMIRQLDRGEIRAILVRNQVGRMVYPRGPRLEVEPVQYLYDGGWLYGRAARIALPGKNGDGRWPAAFEVDEIDSAFEWRTVIVHGGFYTLSEDGTDWERTERVRAIERLRRLVPSAFTPDDPTPGLDVVFRIAVQEVTGHAAASDMDPPRLRPGDSDAESDVALTAPDFEATPEPGTTRPVASDDSGGSGAPGAGAEPGAEAIFGTD
jgi:nitroimidazol reductase NimA-like FMN-containing flavoprotein (pyridoxamine 5'-phosphate oxidase superfamily)